MVKKKPKASLMVIHYSKLLEIFLMSSSHLYHAYAWFKHFTFQKNFNKNLTHKNLKLIASSVVLAALSVPSYDCSYGASHLELENEKERSLRVGNLISFEVESKSENKEVLSRSSLLLDLGVMTCVTQEVKDLFQILEHEFFPLDLALNNCSSGTSVLHQQRSQIGGSFRCLCSVEVSEPSTSETSCSSMKGRE